MAGADGAGGLQKTVSGMGAEFSFGSAGGTGSKAGLADSRAAAESAASSAFEVRVPLRRMASFDSRYPFNLRSFFDLRCSSEMRSFDPLKRLTFLRCETPSGLRYSFDFATHLLRRDGALLKALLLRCVVIF